MSRRGIAMIVIAFAAGCTAPSRVTPSAPLERLSTTSAVHAAIQQERVAVAERALDAGDSGAVRAMLAQISGTERAHELEQAAANAAARDEREAAAERVRTLERELTTGTRRWWNVFALVGGACFVSGCVIMVWFAGVRREGAIVASAGALATLFALGVLAILPWMQWLAPVAIGAAVLFLMLAVVRQRHVAERVVATADAAKPFMPALERDAVYGGETPLADLIQDSPTRAFVRQVRSQFHRRDGSPRSARGTPFTPSPGGSRT